MTMRNIVLIVALILLIKTNLYSQCSNCNSNNPTGTQSIASGQSVTVSTCVYGGQYSYYNVVAGVTYTWQTCGDTDFDTQLTLFQGSTCGGGTVLAYNDDNCGLQSTITWTATFTGTVTLLLSKYNCQNQSTCMTLQWIATGGSGGGGGGGGGQDCAHADPFCTGTTYNFPLQVNNGSAESGPNYGCLCTQPNPVWYYLRIGTSGSLNLKISSTCGDIDYAAWGPFPTLTCSPSDLTSTVTGCGGNLNAPAGNMVDCAYSTASTEYLDIPYATAGTYYMVVITNYANCVGNAIFSQTGGTGSTDCSIVTCDITNMTVTPSACNPSTNTYSITGTITFTGQPTTGTLTITDNAGQSQTFNAPFTSPINYTITGITANGSPHTVTAQFSNAPSCNFTVNYTAPAACNTCTANAGPDVSVCGLTTNLAAVIQPGNQTYQWSPTSGITFANLTSPTTSITATSPGTYNLTWNVTMTSGVTCSDQVAVTFTNPQAGFTYNGNQCVTGNSYNFTNTGSTGSGVTYSWSFPGATPSSSTAQNPSGITWSSPGTYTVTQTVTQGSCSATYSQIVTVYPNPTVNITQNNVTCYGACNGSAVATGSGGSGSYTYQWSTGSTSQTISSLCPGTYTVTVRDAYNCSSTASVNITQPAALTLTTTRTNPTCNGLCNGTANVSVSGGIGPFSYLWSNGATTANISGLCAGTYTVTVTDQASPGCTQTANVVLTDPPAMVLSTSKTDATCGMNNGSATVTVVSGGTPNYNYSWSNGSVTNNSPSNTNTISSIGAGSYSVTVTSSNGCTMTATVNVGSSGAPTLTVTSTTNPTCYGVCNGTATVTIGGTLNPPFNYVWSNGYSVMGTSATTNTNTALCSGTTSVTVTDNLGCQAVNNVSLTSPPALNVSTSSVNAFCNQSNGSATANPTGGTSPYSYLWSPSAGSQTTQTANNLAPGTYSVTVTDANGCYQNATVVVGNNPGVTASISSQTNVSCFGGNNGSATATGTGGNLPYTYQWPASAGNQTTATATNLSAGTYTVTVRDANNCTSTATVTITQPSAVTASISSFTNALCNGACNGTATAMGSGGTPPYTYTWSNTQTAQTATGLCNGTYYVTVRDANNCTAVTNVTITQPTLLSATASSTSAYCNQSNGSATVSANGGTPPYSYMWNSGQSSQTITNQPPGNYTVTVTDANGCTAVANTVIGNVAGGTASISSITYTSCNGVCDGSATVSMAGGTPPYTYLWSNGANTPTINGLCENIYTVTVTDAGGCTATAVADVKSPNPLLLSIDVNDVFCFNQCTGQISVTPSGGTSPYTYLWSNNSFQPTISNLCSGVYSVTVTDSHNCTATGSGTISSIPPITLSANVTNANCNQSNGSIDLFISGGALPFTFNWSNGNNTEDLINVQAGVYNVTVTDIKGCSATGSYTVTNVSGPTASISSFSHVTCYDACNGIATGLASNGTPPYIYSWSNGQNSQTTTNLCPGTYVFSVTDAAGCVATANVTITQPPVLQVQSITSINPSCNGSCNGSASIVVVGGTPPYNYLWTGGVPFGGLNPNSPTTTGLCNGMLTVTVTDANGCTILASTGVVEPSLLSLISFSTPVLCAGQNTGSAGVSANGGTPPYTYQWSANTGGQTTAVATNLGAGTYTVTVTDSRGCTESISVNVTSPQPLVFSNITSTDIPCYMQNNGTISVNVSGGTPPYSYNWTNSIGTFSSTNQNIGNLPAETYFLTVTDANGCFITTNVVINQPPLLQLNLQKTDETCYQFCNGTIQANVWGGQNPYSYLWSNGQTSQSIQNLCPGNYSVTVTDNNGCTISSNINVIGPPLLQIDVVNVVPATCGQSNGEALISFQGGTTGYTIQWSTGGTTVHETNMPAGNHTVTVIDQNGCIATQVVSIQNLQGPSITSITPSHVTCYGSHNGVAIVTYTPSNPPAPPYITTWSNGMHGDTITGLSGGIYYVTVEDANGCMSVGSVIIQEPTVLTSVISGVTHNHCYGQCIGTASVLAGGGTPPYTYNWLGIGQSGSSATNLCAGTYNVVVVDANGCTSTNTVVINQPSELNIQATVQDALCYNSATGNISINVSGGTPVYQYNWQAPVNSTNSVAANLPAGTYTVIVTDSWNCTQSATFTVNQPLPLQAYVTANSAHCGLNNGSAVIDSIVGGTPAYSVLWSPGNMTNYQVSNLASGIYQLIVTDANNCTLVQQVPIGQVLGPEQININKTNATCYGYYDGSAIANVIGGLPPYQYLWNNGQTTQTAINLGAGIYTVTVTDQNGCTRVSSVQITEPNPVIPIANGSDTICMGNFSINITANAIGGTPPYTFMWSGPGITNPSSQVQLVSPDSTTNYFVNVYDANGCASANPASITVYVYPPVTASVSNDVIICKGTEHAIYVNASGGKPPYTYVWNNGIGNPNIVSPNSTYTYIVSVYDACGSVPAVDSMTITVKEVPIIIRNPQYQKGCVPLEAYFDCLLDPSSYPVTYLWNFGDPSSGMLNLSNDSTATHIYNIPGNYSVTLTITSSFGCQTIVTYNNIVKVSPYPQVSFTYSPTSNITPVNGDVWFSAQSDPNNLLIWYFGDGTSASGITNPMHTYNQAGVYTVMLIARNIDGCVDTAIHILNVNDYFTLWAPSAFSPGSGKANGFWYPRGLGIDSSDYYLAIYDRWGQIIFETRNMPKGTNLTPSEVITQTMMNNNWEPGGWNGGYQNDITRLVPTGSYIWYVRVKEKDTGYIHEKKGIVTVLR